jgi:hypothetical protein
MTRLLSSALRARSIIAMIPAAASLNVSIAAPPDWIEVDGGTWIPRDVLRQVQSSYSFFVEQAASDQGLNLPELGLGANGMASGPVCRVG